MAEAQATQNHTTENSTKSDVSKETQNEYLLIVNKKIRSLNKKLQKVTQIEKKISEGGKVNEEQQGLLKSKANTEKQLKDFEKIKKAMLSIHQADEEKQKGSVQQQQQRDLEAKADATRALVHLIHFAAAFDATTPEGNATLTNFLAEQEQQRASGNNVRINNESDIHVLISLANAISKRQSGVNSVDHALKYSIASQEVYASGVSYAHLREQVAELASSAFFSPQVPVEVHQHQEQPVDEVQPTEEPVTHVQQEQQDAQEPIPTQEGQQVDSQEGFQEKGNQRKGGNYRGRGRRGRGGFHHNKEHRENKEHRDNNREHRDNNKEHRENNREHRENNREHRENNRDHKENRGRGGQRGNRGGQRGNRGGQGNQSQSQPAQQ